MGRAAKRNRAQEGSTSDQRAVERALRRLNLIDSRNDLSAWMQQATARLHDTDVDAWASAYNAGDMDGQYAIGYQSLQHALTLVISQRSHMLEVELSWMVPLLRAEVEIARERGEDPLLVEVGSGTGVAAIVVSQLLDVPVLAVDQHQACAPIATELAQRSGAAVTAHTLKASEVLGVLDGARPTAIFGMSTLRYLQPHQHPGVGEFSCLADFRARRTGVPAVTSEEFGALLEAVQGAPLIFSEASCPDYLAELESATGFEYAQDAGALRLLSGHVVGKSIDYLGMVLRAGGATPATEEELLAGLTGVFTAPPLNAPLNGSRAEVFRRQLGELPVIDAWEFVYNDGSGIMRTEASSYNGGLVVYQASNQGQRVAVVIGPRDRDDTLDALRDEAETVRDFALVHALTVPACSW